ncbi:hypothetical protein DSO57_1002608 [Entomophthora muscae]|uniref:Uncharacterized protein n=1 Tax=Entomophthora muscae TaxID=34485 RepID=A0ACC2U7C2_9FUNG|nr:hypothetical protein DSO57_1002608 [Entomophthora muscae]
MVFNNNIFNGASSQASSSQASFNGGKAQNIEAPVYTQAFEVGNKEPDLYLTTNSNSTHVDTKNVNTFNVNTIVK